MIHFPKFLPILLINALLFNITNLKFNNDHSEINSFESLTTYSELCSDSDKNLRSFSDLSNFGVSITITDLKSWYKNQIRAHLDFEETKDFQTIRDKYKKDFDATVRVSNGKWVCEYGSKIRITGDLTDHLGEVDGKPISSISVTLKQGNIGGVVKFKLLLPGTRNGPNEVLTTALLRELDFLAPRTRISQVEINGIKSDYLIQEDIVKELLESQHRREGPIVELDEKLFFYNNKINGNWNNELLTPKINNSKWINNSEIRVLTTQAALGKLANAHISHLAEYRKNPKTKFINPNTLSEVHTKLNLKNFEFFTILFALEAQHGLNPNNRRFYYDAITDGLEPIYYDGNASILSGGPYTGIGMDIWTPPTLPESNLEKEIMKRASPSLIEAIGEIDVDSFTKELQMLGLQIDGNFTSQLINLLKNRFLLYLSHDVPTSIPEKIEPDKTQFRISEFPMESKVVTSLTGTLGKICMPLKEECSTEKFAFQETVNLLSGTLSKSGINYYFQPNAKLNSLDYELLNEVSIGDGKLQLYGEFNFEIDQINNQISLNKLSPRGRAIFLGVDLKSWHIEFTDSAESDGLRSDRSNVFGTTGCLNFYDSHLNSVAIEVKNSKCEDAVNFVRTKGKISKISIIDSLQDGLDADFSELEFSFINILNSGNDCIDFSTGSYNVVLANVSRCGDKGVSVGEKGILNFNQGTILNSRIGIASKDWSEIYAKKLEIYNVEQCLAAYRKKQEFGAGSIKAVSLDCPSDKFFIQKFSLIEIGNWG